MSRRLVHAFTLDGDDDEYLTDTPCGCGIDHSAGDGDRLLADIERWCPRCMEQEGYLSVYGSGEDERYCGNCADEIVHEGYFEAKARAQGAEY